MTTAPMPEYIVTVPEASIGATVAIALGLANATLCRREQLPSGATVYRPESTGNVKALCRHADQLNDLAAERAAAAELTDAAWPLDAQTPPSEPIPLDDLEADLPAADDPSPCGSAACDCGPAEPVTLADPDATPGGRREPLNLTRPGEAGRLSDDDLAEYGAGDTPRERGK